MKISLVITNTKRKSIAFIADTLEIFSLEEAVRSIKNKFFENVYLVSSTAGTYIRSSPDTKKNNNIDTLSITGPQLIAIAQGIIMPTLAIQTYVVRYLASIDQYILGAILIPSPSDKKLPFSGNLTNANRRYLYQYVIQPEHNIRFAAAFIRHVINFWSEHIDLTNRPEIIGTLYNQGYGSPNPHPKSIERGEQIAEEFYPLAKKWFD